MGEFCSCSHADCANNHRIMSAPSDSSFLSRRQFSTTTSAGAALLAGLPNPLGAAESRRPNLIRHENAKAGSRDWQLTRVRPEKRGAYRSSDIEGYCSRQSVEAGDPLDIMVSTREQVDFTIEIFRTGYYGGRGARLMKTLGPIKGGPQPTPKPRAARCLVPGEHSGLKQEHLLQQGRRRREQRHGRECARRL